VSIIGWLVVGAIGGYAANLILGRQSEGIIRTVVFGIVGAVIGGLIGGFITSGSFNLDNLMNSFDITSIIVAIIGAVGLGLVSGWWDKRQAAG
jgi:uncharacterized membrane protein YeaQ/YmgE (transglycosylase-associated protein family)